MRHKSVQGIIVIAAVFLGLILAPQALAQQVDYGAWEKVLTNYVTDRGLVNYQELKKDRDLLGRFIDQQIAGQDLSKLSKTQRKAFWINTYNALTLQLIVDHYPMKFGGIRTINFGQPWNLKMQAADRKISLGEIEHDILRKWEPIDPRIHFAINCASMGCPVLPRQPFYPDKLDQQLDKVAHQFINNSEKVRLDRENNILYYSAIFSWFEEDFLATHSSILDYILDYIDRPDKEYIEANRSKINLKQLEYDWGLNALNKPATFWDKHLTKILWILLSMALAIGVFILRMTVFSGGQNKDKKNRAALIIAFVIFGLIIGALVYGVTQHKQFCPVCYAKSFSPQVVRHYIQGFGSWAILVYVLLYIINTITLIPPIAIMSLSAGVLFGPIWGTVALTLGAFCGTSTTFVLSRFLGRRFVDRFLKGKAADFNKKISQNGFLVLLPIRLIGFPPYEFVNYASGLSKISYKDYISATMLGMMPAIIIQVLLADRLANFSWKDPVLYVAVGLFILMGVITGKMVKKKQQKGELKKEYVSS